jgi:D-glycero-D-manno-heptose 1,7-bisphosphate phosphatase
VVVTNQQGVGRGLMTQIELTDIHDQMRHQVMAADGRNEDVMVCSHLASLRCRCRKPRAGLPLGWLAGHPHVDPEKCVVVGDSWTDIAMGRMATSGRGATVWIGPGDQQEPVPAPDARFDSLRAFADFTVAVLAEKESA